MVGPVVFGSYDAPFLFLVEFQGEEIDDCGTEKSHWDGFLKVEEERDCRREGLDIRDIFSG